MIGIDIGRVIISGDTDIPNQFFSEDYLSVLPVNQAFDAIRQIVEKYGSAKVHLVSKCGEQTQQRTLHWLDYHQFFEITEVLRSQVWFCRERHQKQGICETQGIRTFIDDRFTVLQHLLELDRLLLFCPSEKELEAYDKAGKPSRVQIVEGWEAALKALI